MPSTKPAGGVKLGETTNDMMGQMSEHCFHTCDCDAGKLQDCSAAKQVMAASHAFSTSCNEGTSATNSAAVFDSPCDGLDVPTPLPCDSAASPATFALEHSCPELQLAVLSVRPSCVDLQLAVLNARLSCPELLLAVLNDAEDKF
jgi:hypothetical protein